MTSVEVLEKSNTRPPRDNGALIFEAPWETRAFGMAVDLVDNGHMTWDGFRDHLVKEISDWESTPTNKRGTWAYYECWISALESVTIELNIVGQDEVNERSLAYASRPHGHDH